MGGLICQYSNAVAMGLVDNWEINNWETVARTNQRQARGGAADMGGSFRSYRA